MSIESFLIFSFSFILLGSCNESIDDPEMVLKKSIQFHNPNLTLNKVDATFNFESSFSWNDSIPEHLSIDLDFPNYEMVYQNHDRNLHYQFKQDTCLTLKGKMSCKDFIWSYDFYFYIWALPMNLPGNGKLNKELEITSFNGVEAYVVKVEYEKDKWKYYFNTSNFELVGFEFKKKDESGHGERVVLADTYEYKSIKFPKKRRWYSLPDMEFLGENILINIK